MATVNPYFLKARSHYEASSSYKSSRIVSRVAVSPVDLPKDFVEVNPFDVYEEDPNMNIIYTTELRATKYLTVSYYGKDPSLGTESKEETPITGKSLEIITGYKHPVVGNRPTQTTEPIIYEVDDIGFVNGSIKFSQKGRKTSQLGLGEALLVAPTILLLGLLGTIYNFGVNLISILYHTYHAFADFIMKWMRGDSNMYPHETLLVGIVYTLSVLVRSVFITVFYIFAFPVILGEILITGTWEWSFDYLKYVIQLIRQPTILQDRVFEVDLLGISRDMVSSYADYELTPSIPGMYSLFVVIFYSVYYRVKMFIVNLLKKLTWANIRKWARIIWQTFIRSGLEWIASFFISIPLVGGIVAIMALGVDIYTFPYFVYQTWVQRTLIKRFNNKEYVLGIFLLFITPIAFLGYWVGILWHLMFTCFSQIDFIHELLFGVYNLPPQMVRAVNTSGSTHRLTNDEFNDQIKHLPPEPQPEPEPEPKPNPQPEPKQLPFSQRWVFYRQSTHDAIMFVWRFVHRWN